MVVSRAEFKLADAVNAWGFSFEGKHVLDIGSSTGGFTECALNAGARRVLAVERGTHQMKAPLRFDPRVDLREKTDIFELKLQKKPDVILADVSFVSLRKVLAYAKKRLAGKQTDFLVMLKPQFEAAPRELVRGVVKNEKMRREIIQDFEAWLKRNGFIILKKRDNDLAGRHGNVERFYWLRLSG